MDGVGELGKRKALMAHQMTRKQWMTAPDEMGEVKQKESRNYGGSAYMPSPIQDAIGFQHFGPVIVSCSAADFRLTPQGVEVHDVNGVHLLACPKQELPRQEVLDEVWSVARSGKRPVHDGAWSKATMEVCLGILTSARERKVMIMHHQIPHDGST